LISASRGWRDDWFVAYDVEGLGMNERRGRRGIYVPELVDAIIRKTIDSYTPPAEKASSCRSWQSMVGCSYTANQNARNLELN
jgi:hypothetical protein